MTINEIKAWCEKMIADGHGFLHVVILDTDYDQPEELNLKDGQLVIMGADEVVGKDPSDKNKNMDVYYLEGICEGRKPIQKWMPEEAKP
jgi:hypothetical protein